jgi:hypothetical protein
MFRIPYLLHAYDVSESSFKRRRIETKEGKICRPPSELVMHLRGTSFINNSQICKERYKARRNKRYLILPDAT